MSTPLFAELTARAGSLSAEERVQLAQGLLDSVEPADAALDQAWQQEVGQRIARIDAGETLLPADEVLTELKRQYG
jgi:putative addiction module component (TIGR02574 family)